MQYRKINESDLKLHHIGYPGRFSGSIILKLLMVTLITFGVGLLGYIIYTDFMELVIERRKFNKTTGLIQSQEDILLERSRKAMDIENPVTRNYATQLAALNPGSYNLNQVINLYDYLYQNWRYVSDPRGIEYLSSASNTITNKLIGDCDDFAILIATLIESIGGKARISFAYNKRGGHTFAEVYVPLTEDEVAVIVDKHYQDNLEKALSWSRIKKIHFRPDLDGKGIWLNLDWTSKYPGGKYFDWDECTVFYPREGVYRKGG